jgi:hypothetical protein
MEEATDEGEQGELYCERQRQFAMYQKAYFWLNK